MSELDLPAGSLLTRRDLLVSSLRGLGAAGVAAVAAGCAPSGPGTPPTGQPQPGPGGAPARTGAAGRMPVAFLPHGGGPWPFVELGFPRPEMDALAAYLASVRALPPTPPRALLVISAHWEERVATVMTSPAPPMLYDYYGFPEASYQLSWPAPGSPAVARRVQEVLAQAGLPSATDAARGFDHGTFVPMMLTYPGADIPTVQLSLLASLDPAEHLALGRALAPLRDEGVFIIGSGMTFHNLRAFFDRSGRGRPVAEEFDAWLRTAAVAAPGERERLLTGWQGAPSARLAHPREEHLLPLMVCVGAAGGDPGTIAYNGTFAGLRLSAYHYS